MKDCFTFTLVATLSFGLLAGCSRSSNTNKPQSLQETSKSLKSAFAAAPASVREEAASAATAIEQNDATAAFFTVYQLSSHPELSTQQRQVAAQSMATLYSGLAKAAESGDAQAKRALDLYRAAK